MPIRGRVFHHLARRRLRTVLTPNAPAPFTTPAE